MYANVNPDFFRLWAGNGVPDPPPPRPSKTLAMLKAWVPGLSRLTPWIHRLARKPSRFSTEASGPLPQSA